MTQEKFDTIYQRAAHRKGGAAELEKIVRAPPFPSRVIENHRRSLASRLYRKSIPVWYFVECGEKEVAAI